MKVGILTFHRASNYGTALQAYATVKIIQKCGLDVEIIDYRPKYIESTLQERRLNNEKNIKTIASILLNKGVYGRQIKEKIDRFQEFIQTIPVSNSVCSTVQDIQQIAGMYDVIVSGSDQLWNEKITGKDLTYFLPFAHPRKISYASSFGTSVLSDRRKEEIRPYLCDFKAISAREKTAVELLSEILRTSNDKDIIVNRVADPTLLLEKEDWISQSNPSVSTPSNGYILTYYMIETPILRAITKQLKNKTGLPILNIKPSKKQMLLHEGINMMWAGPREFLSCYAGAKYVVTNSFHGTAFAINFGIPMYVSPLPVSMAGEVNSRLVDILDWYGLSDRWIDSISCANKIGLQELPISLENTKRLHREKSIEVLKSMLMEKSTCI